MFVGYVSLRFWSDVKPFIGRQMRMSMQGQEDGICATKHKVVQRSANHLHYLIWSN